MKIIIEKLKIAIKILIMCIFFITTCIFFIFLSVCEILTSTFIEWTVEALSNLVDNGLKYTPEGGKVRIQTVILPSMVRVDVSDTGRGICEEEQAAIFGRFYRSQEMSEKPGMGIGLYAAREIMRAQNGYIQVQSRPGKGSVFSVYFLREKISQN